jgi:hypothetical protein
LIFRYQQSKPSFCLRYCHEKQNIFINTDYRSVQLILNPRERIGFAELSAKWRIGSPLLAAESASIKNLP